jgi:HSP20 family protein
VPPAWVAGGVSEEVRAVLRFDPFRDFDRIAEQLLGAQSGTARVPRFMPVDLYRSGDHYVLHADLPGVDPGSIDVNVENSTLTIRAERSATPEEGIQWIGSERPTGTYQRQLVLGEDVAADDISATYENGVLTITMPVAERAKPRKVQITTSGSSGNQMTSASSRQEISA